MLRTFLENNAEERWGNIHESRKNQEKDDRIQVHTF